MSPNSEAIMILCSHLCVPEDLKPLEPHEWSKLAENLMKLNLTPEQLLGFEHSDFTKKLGIDDSEAERMERLIARSGSLRFALTKYEDIGMLFVTRADADYPPKLKKKLGNGCPPMFYCAGDLRLLTKPAAGYVGSRNVDEADIDFTGKAVAATAKNGYAVVSGGAKGVDSFSAVAALREGVAVIECLADSMLRKLKDKNVTSEIRAGHMLLLSAVSPDAGFSVGTAMMRNRYIYAQSDGTVVVHSEKGKGGTWAGATENLKKEWCHTFCRDCDYPGNRELIKMGAIPIDETWDGRLTAPEIHKKAEEKVEQLSLFDL